MAGYTYSKTIDDGSYDLEQPQNPYIIGDERTLSLQDQRHRFTLSGLWLIGPDLSDPADAARNANPGPLMKALTGLGFAPIVSIVSGFRANPITGLDSNREHIFPFAARPDAYGRNALATPVNVDVDLRVLKMIPVEDRTLRYGGRVLQPAESPQCVLAQHSIRFKRPASVGFRRTHRSIDRTEDSVLTRLRVLIPKSTTVSAMMLPLCDPPRRCRFPRQQLFRWPKPWTCPYGRRCKGSESCTCPSSPA